MRLLLDTHVLVWCLSGDRKLPPATAELIRNPATDVYFSAVSIWEVAIKSALGKMRADANAMLKHLVDEGFKELPVMARHTVATVTLPMHHRDPFDRLLVAQSRLESLRLLTDDKIVALYGEPVVLVG
jgi:PIN domain nuclease of toxin-antitoxin system